MARSRSVVATLVMVLVGLAPAVSAQDFANEPPDYFVDMQWERYVQNQSAPDSLDRTWKVAGVPAYHDDGDVATLATWISHHDPDIQDNLTFSMEDLTVQPQGFRLVDQEGLPPAWWGHEFHRQWLEMNDDYLIVAGWSPTLSSNNVLVYYQASPENWVRTFDFSRLGPGAAPASYTSYAWTRDVPTDDIDLSGRHVAWAGGGTVRVFYDYCSQLEDQVWQPVVDPNVNTVIDTYNGLGLPAPAPVLPPWSSGPRTSYTYGNCWVEEPFGPTHELFNPTYAVDGNVAIRFWENSQGLFLAVLDPLFDNGPDHNYPGMDLPKGRLQVYRHNDAEHSWSLLPTPANLPSIMPHDSRCPQTLSFGDCYHYTANRVAGAGLAAIGDYLMVTETKNVDPTDYQMAHFYHFNETDEFTYHSFTNITMLFQGTFGHAIWSGFEGDVGKALMHTSDFHQAPFKKKPFFLEEFRRTGSMHELQFTFDEDGTDPKSLLVNKLEHPSTRHYTTCSEVEMVRRPGNLFYTDRGSSDWISFAYEDNTTVVIRDEAGDVVDVTQTRDNRDPSIPHPYLNDVEQLHFFPQQGDTQCDLYLCDDCSLPEPEPNDPDNRDRGHHNGPAPGDDPRDRETADEEEEDQEESSDTDDETEPDAQERPKARFPVDQDGDGVPDEEFGDLETDNCLGFYNPVDEATGAQPDCPFNDEGDELAGSPGGRAEREDLDASSLRPASKLPAEAWVTLAIGLVLVLLVFLVARRRSDDEE